VLSKRITVDEKGESTNKRDNKRETKKRQQREWRKDKLKQLPVQVFMEDMEVGSPASQRKVS
jgi:hypothetical protein